MEPQGPTRVELPDDVVEELLARTANRSRVVVEHILAHGFVTTADLADKYGYDHAPRAARDVRERGIPLVSVRVVVDGRRMVAYRFPDTVELDRTRSGRAGVTKAFRASVLDHYDHKCAFTGEQLSPRLLELDHRVPFEVGGDPVAPYRVTDWMLVTRELNRTKSWECEHCPNFVQRQPVVCETCYWARPDGDYQHVATREVRRADVQWSEEEVLSFEKLRQWATQSGVSVPQAIKRVIDAYQQSEGAE